MIRLTALLLALALTAGGCGYTAEGVWAESRTVAVPVFENDTFEAGLGAELTDAVIKELNARTPWAVTRVGGSGTTLSGTITEVRRQNLTTGSTTGLVSEQAIVVKMDFQLVDNATGETIVARRDLSAAGTFVPALPAGERTEIGRRAAVRALARSLVDELRSGW